MEPCLLIRGLSRQQSHWGTFPDCLNVETQRPILFEDLPGFGSRNHLNSPSTVEGISHRIAPALVTHSQKINLIGISMGGMVALDLAHSYPEKVNSLVLINTSFKPYAKFYQRLRPGAYSGFMKAWFNPLRRKSEERILQLSSNFKSEDDEVLKAWTDSRITQPPSRKSVINQMRAASQYYFYGPKPINKILMIASEKDRIVDPICSRNIAQAWGLDILTHASAGHDLALDDPQWLAKNIAQWLGR